MLKPRSQTLTPDRKPATLSEWRLRLIKQKSDGVETSFDILPPRCEAVA
jgi:hypothetical protein